MKITFFASDETTPAGEPVGDCVLIDTGSEAVIYDCGSEAQAAHVIRYLDQHTPRYEKAVLVLSHEDSEHCGGADALIGQGRISDVYTHIFRDHIKEIKKQMRSVRLREKAWMNSSREIIDFPALDFIEAGDDEALTWWVCANINLNFPFTKKYLPCPVELPDGFTPIEGSTVDTTASDDGTEKEEEAAANVSWHDIDTADGFATVCEGVEIVGPEKYYELEAISRLAGFAWPATVRFGHIANKDRLSVLVKVTGDSGQTLLLTGDSDIEMLKPLCKQYDALQLPHHGECINGEALLKATKYGKKYFISDNQGAEAATNSNVLSGNRKYQKSDVHNTRTDGDVEWEF